MNAAGQIGDLGKAVAFQKCPDLRAACAVMADADDRCIGIEFSGPARDRIHRHQRGTFDMAGLVFPRLADVKQYRLGTRCVGDPVGQGRGGDMLHANPQNLKCDGVNALRKGLTLVSNSLVVL